MELIEIIKSWTSPLRNQYRLFFLTTTSWFWKVALFRPWISWNLFFLIFKKYIRVYWTGLPGFLQFQLIQYHICLYAFILSTLLILHFFNAEWTYNMVGWFSINIQRTTPYTSFLKKGILINVLSSSLCRYVHGSTHHALPVFFES